LRVATSSPADGLTSGEAAQHLKNSEIRNVVRESVTFYSTGHALSTGGRKFSCFTCCINDISFEISEKQNQKFKFVKSHSLLKSFELGYRHMAPYVKLSPIIQFQVNIYLTFHSLHRLWCIQEQTNEWYQAV
jgi:hypothetical protein